MCLAQACAHAKEITNSDTIAYIVAVALACPVCVCRGSPCFCFVRASTSTTIGPTGSLGRSYRVIALHVSSIILLIWELSS
jgi:hypothetical protein